jgi:(p)ppGpp synthase/HD superfamily hydrolase
MEDQVMATLEDAILLAAEAHQGQRDRNGQPYVLHVLRVMFRVEGEAQRTAAVLHDVVEDTPHTLDELRERGFSEEVVHAVDCLTHREDEPYEAQVERAASDPIARVVKLADLEDNMDLRRLEDVHERDLPRLQRYLRAWHRLKGEA